MLLRLLHSTSLSFLCLLEILRKPARLAVLTNYLDRLVGVQYTDGNIHILIVNQRCLEREHRAADPLNEAWP